jgi:ATP-dependent DNA ligase
MSPHSRSLPTGFVAPCLPTAAPAAALRRGVDARVRLYSRPGNDLTDRFPLIVDAIGRLRAGSCIIDGEAVSYGEDGIASFERMRDWRHGDSVFLWAFDLIELNGDDLRRNPLAVRKATLASMVAGAEPAPGRCQRDDYTRRMKRRCARYAAVWSAPAAE